MIGIRRELHNATMGTEREDERAEKALTERVQIVYDLADERQKHFLDYTFSVLTGRKLGDLLKEASR